MPNRRSNYLKWSQSDYCEGYDNVGHGCNTIYKFNYSRKSLCLTFPNIIKTTNCVGLISITMLSFFRSFKLIFAQIYIYVFEYKCLDIPNEKGFEKF